MSAENYRVCPYCPYENTDEIKEAIEQASKLEEGYDYHMALAEVDELKSKQLGYTLAEYYELGVIGNGVFHLDYWCKCEKCGYEFEITLP